jgi:uncharacterized protein (DUF488 family)
MKLSTSYFAQAKKLRAKGLTTVCIALGTPRFYKGLSYKKIAPERSMLKLEGEAYIRSYNRLLSGLDPRQTVEDLRSLTGNAAHAALLCYEKPGTLCHRRLVAEWLKNSLGMEVEEITFD